MWKNILALLATAFLIFFALRETGIGLNLIGVNDAHGNSISVPTSMLENIERKGGLQEIKEDDLKEMVEENLPQLKLEEGFEETQDDVQETVRESKTSSPHSSPSSENKNPIAKRLRRRLGAGDTLSPTVSPTVDPNNLLVLEWKAGSPAYCHTITLSYGQTSQVLDHQVVASGRMEIHTDAHPSTFTITLTDDGDCLSKYWLIEYFRIIYGGRCMITTDYFVCLSLGSCPAGKWTRHDPVDAITFDISTCRQDVKIIGDGLCVDEDGRFEFLNVWAIENGFAQKYDEPACEDYCVSVTGCTAMMFERSTKQCTLFSGGPYTKVLAADDTSRGIVCRAFQSIETTAPSNSPSTAPSNSPTVAPSSSTPTTSPTTTPSNSPTVAPSSSTPTTSPITSSPTPTPTSTPTTSPGANTQHTPAVGDEEEDEGVSTVAIEHPEESIPAAAIGAAVGGFALTAGFIVRENSHGRCFGKICPECLKKKSLSDFPRKCRNGLILMNGDKCSECIRKEKVAEDEIKNIGARKESEAVVETTPELDTKVAREEMLNQLEIEGKFLQQYLEIEEKQATEAGEAGEDADFDLEKLATRRRAVTKAVEDVELLREKPEDSTTIGAIHKILKVVMGLKQDMGKVIHTQDAHFNYITKMLLDSHDQATGPNLYVVLPDLAKESGVSGFMKKLKSTVETHWIIHLPCQHETKEGNCHMTAHKGYQVSITKESVRKMAKVISIGFKVASVAATLASAGVCSFGGFESIIPSGESKNGGLTRTFSDMSKTFDGIFKTNGQYSLDDIGIQQGRQTIEQLLAKANAEESDLVGGLQRVYNNGQFRWVCADHVAETEISSKQQDHKTFKLAAERKSPIKQELPGNKNLLSSTGASLPKPLPAKAVDSSSEDEIEETADEKKAVSFVDDASVTPNSPAVPPPRPPVVPKKPPTVPSKSPTTSVASLEIEGTVKPQPPARMQRANQINQNMKGYTPML